MSVTVAPHGLWKSPITGNSFTARSVTLSQVRVDGPDTYWVEGHPLEGGRGTLLRRRGTGETGEVLPLIDGVRLADVGTRVHEYGGKAYAVHHGVIVFSDRSDGRVYAFDTSEPRRGVRPLTTLSKVRYGDFWIADERDLVYAVAEDHSGEGEPVNSIARRRATTRRSSRSLAARISRRLPRSPRMARSWRGSHGITRTCRGPILSFTSRP